MMKPQLYSIIILLLARINYAQNIKTTTQDPAPSRTQLTLTHLTITSVAKTPEESITSTTKAPDDHKTTAPENNVTSVTKTPKGNTTSVAKTSHETTDTVTGLSEAPNSKATSAPSQAPNVSPVRTTKGFTMSDGISRATGDTSISIGSQTSNPILAGNATTQQINNVTNAVHKTTRPTSTKPTTHKTTGNRTSTFPVPSLFAIVLLVVSVLCF